MSPVIIVGAGPVGLALAADLGSRGVPCTVLERNVAAETLEPKIMYIGVRTMEYCRRLGIASDVRNWGFPRDFPQDTVFVTSLRGYELGRIPVPALESIPPSPFSPEDSCHCPQNWFDPILRKLCGTYSEVTFRYGTEFQSYEETANGVVATVRDVASGRTERLETQYLVACDGYSSTVRSLLGISMHGRRRVDYSVNILFRSTNLRRLHDKGDALRYVLIGERGTWATLWAVDGRDLWRLTAYGNEGRDVAALDADEVLKTVGGPALSYEILSVTRWTRRALTAEHMQSGRIFLAGDSAHATPPNGGLGMNTGFADAMNLGWKLAAVYRGWADPGLLDSYEVERLPVAQRAVQEGLNNYDRLTANTRFAALESTDEKGEQTRFELGERLRSENVKGWRPFGIHLGYVYTPSPAVVDDDDTPIDDVGGPYTPTTRPGARAPHAWLASGHSTLDLFGANYTLLLLGEDPPDVSAFLTEAASRRIPVDVHTITEPDVVRLYERPLVLVRPDGHVAWRGDGDSLNASLILNAVSGR